MSLLEEYRQQFEWRAWDQALARCPIAPGQEVLDLGCGPGDVTNLLARQGLRVTGVDQNDELLAAARERYRECNFVRQDLRHLNFGAQRFDGLWCSFTAAYLVDFAVNFERW